MKQREEGNKKAQEQIETAEELIAMVENFCKNSMGEI